MSAFANALAKLLAAETANVGAYSDTHVLFDPKSQQKMVVYVTCTDEASDEILEFLEADEERRAA